MPSDVLCRKRYTTMPIFEKVYTTIRILESNDASFVQVVPTLVELSTACGDRVVDEDAPRLPEP
jgi:hypothetical protein